MKATNVHQMMTYAHIGRDLVREAVQAKRYWEMNEKERSKREPQMSQQLASKICDSAKNAGIDISSLF